MSKPWQETKGYSFHSICIQVKDMDETVLFYQEVFGTLRSLTQACALRVR